MLFSDPLQPTAGQAVNVYYNPDATVLRGRPDVWLRGGWNRLVAFSMTSALSMTLLQTGQHAPSCSCGRAHVLPCTRKLYKDTKPPAGTAGGFTELRNDKPF